MFSYIDINIALKKKGICTQMPNVHMYVNFFFINFYIFNKNMYFNENEHFSKNCSRVTSKDLHVHIYIDKYGISLKTYLT